MVVSSTGSCNQFNVNGWSLLVFGGVYLVVNVFWYCLPCFFYRMCDLFMEFAFVRLQALSQRKVFVTVTTWKRYSFQMVGLNVISYVMCKAFLATHFANGRCCLYWRPMSTFCSVRNHLLTFLHHGLHLFGDGTI